MLKHLFSIIIIILIYFKRISLEKILYQCTFDKENDCYLRSFDGQDEMSFSSSSSLINQNISFDKPNQPWSDVSSIFKLTKNGYQCQIPYRINSNINDLYFCYNSSNEMKCLINNSFEDQCQQGKYQLLLLNNSQDRQFITPIIENSSTNLSCISFYYYLTKSDTIILFINYFNEKTNESKLISGFVDQKINGWNLAKGEFQTNLSSYQIIFQIYRADMTNLDQSFYIALDHITITEGNCEGLIFPLFDNETELFPTRSLFDSSTMFSKNIDITTSNMVISSTNTNEYSSETSTLKILTITTEKNTFQTITTTTNQRTSIEYQNQTITTEKSPYQYSLKTILGLSIGLGIPAAIGIILSSIYLIQFIKKRKTRIISIKQTNIPLKKPSHHHHHHHHHRHHQKTHKKTHRKRDDFV